MSCLASWFIFELIEVWSAPDLSEPLTFKKVSFANDGLSNHNFSPYILQKSHHTFLTFDMNGLSENESGTFSSLAGSASTKVCRFHRFRFHIPAFKIVSFIKVFVALSFSFVQAACCLDYVFYTNEEWFKKKCWCSNSKTLLGGPLY